MLLHHLWNQFPSAQKKIFTLWTLTNSSARRTSCLQNHTGNFEVLLIDDKYIIFLLSIYNTDKSDRQREQGIFTLTRKKENSILGTTAYFDKQWDTPLTVRSAIISNFTLISIMLRYIFVPNICITVHCALFHGWINNSHISSEIKNI